LNADEVRELLALRAKLTDETYRIVTFDETAAWPDRLLQELVTAGALKLAQPAETVTCVACDEHHVAEVQVLDEPAGSARRHYISCPERGRVLVEPERLQRWQIRRNVPQTSLEKTGRPEESGGPDAHWPPTAAAFAEILRQAHKGGATTLRWHQIRERLGVLGYHPHRTRDVRRHVDNWDDVIESPVKGSYRLRPEHQTPT
jgi:hypothetical protein